MDRISNIYLHHAMLAFENGNKDKARLLCQKIKKITG